jgi:hypothetical protein
MRAVPLAFAALLSAAAPARASWCAAKPVVGVAYALAGIAATTGIALNVVSRQMDARAPSEMTLDRFEGDVAGAGTLRGASLATILPGMLVPLFATEIAVLTFPHCARERSAWLAPTGGGGIALWRF